jgi:hypothetical protein
MQMMMVDKRVPSPLSIIVLKTISRYSEEKDGVSAAGWFRMRILGIELSWKYVNRSRTHGVGGWWPSLLSAVIKSFINIGALGFRSFMVA